MDFFFNGSFFPFLFQCSLSVVMAHFNQCTSEVKHYKKKKKQTFPSEVHRFAMAVAITEQRPWGMYADRSAGCA